MKKFLFFTVLATGVNTCLPAETPVDASKKTADANKKMLEEANKKLQEEKMNQLNTELSEAAKQILKKEIENLKKCAKESKQVDEQSMCLKTLKALLILMENPKKNEVTDYDIRQRLKPFLSEKSVGVCQMHPAYQLVDIKEIV